MGIYQNERLAREAKIRARRRRKSCRRLATLVLALSAPVCLFIFQPQQSVQIQPKAAGVEQNRENPADQAGEKPEDDWMLLLVNPWNSLPDGYEVALEKMKNGHSVDVRCYPELQQMMDDCRAAGNHPLICSSYRSQEKQQSLFDRKIGQYASQGYSLDQAREEAASWVAVPGTSEHQSGLALDIVDKDHQVLDASQEKTPVQQWLMENSWKYGFVLRYPSDKSSVTGITYEPWHYRYVGKTAAREMRERGVCLEEYLGAG